jgi:hypothetical protein
VAREAERRSVMREEEPERNCEFSLVLNCEGVSRAGWGDEARRRAAMIVCDDR